jgi:hypothetical protein
LRQLRHCGSVRHAAAMTVLDILENEKMETCWFSKIWTWRFPDLEGVPGVPKINHPFDVRMFHEKNIQF